jgi:hypothetical protein
LQLATQSEELNSLKGKEEQRVQALNTGELAQLQQRLQQLKADQETADKERQVQVLHLVSATMLVCTSHLTHMLLLTCTESLGASEVCCSEGE